MMKHTLLAILTLTTTTTITLALPAASSAPGPSTAAAAGPVQTTSISYDTKYDTGATSLNTVSCSDGSNGLLTQNYTTFDSLPNFPLIGGAPTVEGWNSPNCGKCYRVSYDGGKVKGSVNVLAVDVAKGAFNLGKQAMDRLTGGQAEAMGRVQGTYVEVEGDECGL